MKFPEVRISGGLLGRTSLGVSLADEVRWGLEELGADGIALSLHVACVYPGGLPAGAAAQTAYRVAEGLKDRIFHQMGWKIHCLL